MTGTTLEDLRRMASSCTACPLYRHATQTVFGKGDPRAHLVLVGEQPGHEEDLAGRPFVGPAGRSTRRWARPGSTAGGCTSRMRSSTSSGPRTRAAASGASTSGPARARSKACRPWLEQELWLIRPEVVVCLGVTAASAVLRKRVTISRSRGESLESPEGLRTFVTVHPSAILRIPDPEHRKAELHRFVHDLRRAARAR